MDLVLAKRLKLITSHPRYFLEHCVFTKDGNSLDNPCRKFPYQLDYHKQICDVWFDNRLFIIEKSRQMQITWTMLGMHLWLGMTGSDREIYFRRQNFEDSLKLLSDMEYIYDHIPEDMWPRKFRPKKQTKEGIFMLPELNTVFYAVSSGKDKMRGRTPTAVLLDEFAFQEDDEMVYQTLKPSLSGGARISIVSTPCPVFGGEYPYFRRIINDDA